MLHFLIRRMGTLLITVLLASLVVFLVIRLLPGDPAQVILGLNADKEKLRDLREEMGLNKHIALQYLDWIKGLIHGDLGKSIYYGKSISSLIGSRLLVSIPLALLSMVFAILIAVPIGLYVAQRPGTLVDYFITFFAQIGISVPAFWVGILLLMFFSVRWQLFPAGGFTNWSSSFTAALKSLLLPAFSLGLIRMSALVKMTRSAALDVFNEEYVLVARAKGLLEKVVVYKHVLKNASISILTLIGLQIGQLLAGAIVIENVFHLPGLGAFLLGSVESRDLPAVQGVVVFLVAAIIIINFLIDLTYSYLDPRIRYD